MQHAQTVQLILTLLLVVGFLGWSGCTGTESPARPNIILIMADDLGWGDVGFNGNTVIQTPHLDRLAAGGVRLERFYAASAVCSPTRASVLTGRNPIRVGVPTANSGHLNKEEHTLAEMLKDAHYATGHFGKWHLGTLTTSMRDSNRGRTGDSTHFSIPTEHGFDTYFSTEAKVPTFDPMLKPVAYDTLRGESLRYGWAAVDSEAPSAAYGTHYWTDTTEPETINLAGDNSKVIMDRVLPFISNAADAGAPFFTVIWFHTPHLPVVADTLYRNRYAEYTHEEQLYYGTISAMDDQVGRLVSHLETLGVVDDTMIWFGSDNGPEIRTPGSAGPFRERKRSLHEGGVRVPAFLHWPAAIPRGASLAVPAVTSDYLPTVAEWLRLPVPASRPLDGISLVPLLSEERMERGTPIGFYFRQQRSWVNDTYKLITKDEGQSYELYNIVTDPEEQHNIIMDYPDQAAQMREQLLVWEQEVAEAPME